jgi:hypothetical protein
MLTRLISRSASSESLSANSAQHDSSLAAPRSNSPTEINLSQNSFSRSSNSTNSPVSLQSAPKSPKGFELASPYYQSLSSDYEFDLSHLNRPKPRSKARKCCIITAKVSGYFFLLLAAVLTLQQVIVAIKYDNSNCSLTPKFSLSQLRIIPEAVRSNFSLAPGLLELPINAFRMLGSHNSYHQTSWLPISAFSFQKPEIYDMLGTYYWGVRQLEIDIHVSKGPGGFTVYHVQLWDDSTSCFCLSDCLVQIRDWRAKFPQEFPLFLFFELKSRFYEDFSVGVNGVTCTDIMNLQSQIISVLGSEEIILPRTVLGNFPTINAAIRYQAWQNHMKIYKHWTSPVGYNISDEELAAESAEMSQFDHLATENPVFGWPTLGNSLGKILIFWLDDVWNSADRLNCITGAGALRKNPDSALFVAQSSAEKPDSAMIILNGALLQQENYRKHADLLARKGFISRILTKPEDDSLGEEGQFTPRFLSSLSSSVHVLSSDAEPPCGGERDKQLKGHYVHEKYCEWLPPEKWPWLCNPYTAPEWCQAALQRVRQDFLQRRQQ